MHQSLFHAEVLLRHRARERESHVAEGRILRALDAAAAGRGRRPRVSSAGSTFDTITRHAAGVVSRRGSLRLLGGAALAGALAAPELTSAGKGKVKKQANKQCKKQGGQCRAFVLETCAQVEDRQACEEAYAPCCKHFERCDAGAGLRCFSEPIGEL